VSELVETGENEKKRWAVHVEGDEEYREQNK
jgi:hypothetical protein